jgi:hypothetical protein
MRFRSTVLLAATAGFVAALAISQAAEAAITWKGHTWNVTGGGMAGVCQGNASNVSIDTNGYLHMKITNNGGTWTAAEIFSTDKIGFGTYQWQIEGAIDKIDKNVVIGLYPYGPAGGLGNSGNNEIDIEFAHWGNDAWDNGNYTIWPPTGSGSSSHTFDFSLGGGTFTTTRFTWSAADIKFATMSGLEPVGSTAGLIDSWTFAPANPTTKITQVAMPLGMNVWCFDNPPSDAKEVEIIFRDFTFVPLGAVVDAGAGGADGAAGAGGAGGSGGKGGAAGTDAAAGSGGAGGTAGMSGAAGASGTGGVGATGGGGSGGSAGAAGSAGTTATAGAGGSSGTAGAGGLVGTAGTTLAGGSGGASGAVGIGGASGAATGSGGGAGASSAAEPATEQASGCSCGIANPHTALGGRMLLLAGALLVARARKRKLPD